jgi:hypothetical protein
MSPDPVGQLNCDEEAGWIWSGKCLVRDWRAKRMRHTKYVRGTRMPVRTRVCILCMSLLDRSCSEVHQLLYNTEELSVVLGSTFQLHRILHKLHRYAFSNFCITCVVEPSCIPFALAFAFSQPFAFTMAGWLIPPIDALAIPAVSALIFFLAYTSQYLFYYLQPGPLSTDQAVWFNGFVLCIWWCYDRACTVDPGPKGWAQKVTPTTNQSHDNESGGTLEKGLRWCKKCDAVKPPRAHHCRQCGRYGTPMSPRYLQTD